MVLLSAALLCLGPNMLAAPEYDPGNVTWLSVPGFKRYFHVTRKSKKDTLEFELFTSVEKVKDGFADVEHCIHKGRVLLNGAELHDPLPVEDLVEHVDRLGITMPWPHDSSSVTMSTTGAFRFPPNSLSLGEAWEVDYPEIKDKTLHAHFSCTYKSAGEVFGQPAFEFNYSYQRDSDIGPHAVGTIWFSQKDGSILKRTASVSRQVFLWKREDYTVEIDWDKERGP